MGTGMWWFVILVESREWRVGGKGAGESEGEGGGELIKIDFFQWGS